MIRYELKGSYDNEEVSVTVSLGDDNDGMRSTFFDFLNASGVSLYNNSDILIKYTGSDEGDELEALTKIRDNLFPDMEIIDSSIGG